ncbi:Calmodulin-binding transcription activator 3 [Acorus calamus]|uniref:Calmodulin-binding transcription activator 3 n=1 Tax=Acorus calamus TaxID=4465 RepID=A0AAV9D626_ACOCL|nr:Calmodulin-binding transcription activator 3 [Acorus calamus]
MTRRLISSMLDGNSAVKDGTDVGYKVQPNASQPTVARDVQRSAQEHPKEDGDKCTQQFPDKRVIDDARHIYQVPHDLPFHAMPQYQMNDGFSIPSNDHSVEVETNCRPVKDAPEGGLNHHEGLKKLDSFGRWMDKEIGGDCDDSLMPSDSGSYWNTLDTHPEKQEVPSLSHRMQLDIDSLCPSLAQEQLFSIRDFSPDWGYSGVETKVLISGVFLSDMNHPSSMKWCCMFGELEVPAEVLTAYALRCQAPSHATGRVPFYITCGNRLACSEVREFEYRENSSNSNLLSEKTEAEEEVHFQVRFAKMLFHGRDGSRPSCSIEKCNKCSLQNDIRRMQTDHENEWGKIENIIRASEVNRKDPRDILIENFSKPRLCEWLICKIHEEGKGPNVLDEEGQGVIHLAAALGYEWAMYLIVAAGVNPSFRDARGRTGLHWAASFGREETVASLIRLGAPPDAVEDPTSKFPEGQTAADLASSRGHKGIAGYLAEAHLTSQLLSLTLQESVMGSVSATLAAEKAIESVQMEGLVSLTGDGRDMISLRRSLDAVRNSAQAAARIQTAFRLQSFRLRQLTKSNDENSEIEMLVGSLNKTEKIGNFNDHLHGAAAHVRGYRVRKQYRKLVWSVGILEKVILRWRRKRSGLRGFTAVKAGGTIEPGIGKIDEYDFLRQGRKQKEAGVEKALARVHSMARYQESRDQYMRLVTQLQKFKIKDKKNASTEDQNQEEKRAREDILSPMID